jgi:transcriptional regulator CtsR
VILEEILAVIDHDSNRQVEQVINSLVEQDVCTRREAEVAMQLFGYKRPEREDTVKRLADKIIPDLLRRLRAGEFDKAAA